MPIFYLEVLPRNFLVQQSVWELRPAVHLIMKLAFQVFIENFRNVMYMETNVISLVVVSKSVGQASRCISKIWDES